MLSNSATENTPLFDAARAGLGQFAVITRAHVRVRRVLPRVRTFRLAYGGLETLMRDFAQILARGRFDYLLARCRHRDQRFLAEDDDWPVAGDWCYPMDVSVEFDAEPDEAELLAGLHHDGVISTVDRDVVEHADLREPMPLPAVRYAATDLSVPVTEAYLPWPVAAACVTRLPGALPPPLLASTSVVLRLRREPGPSGHDVQASARSDVARALADASGWKADWAEQREVERAIDALPRGARIVQAGAMVEAVGDVIVSPYAGEVTELSLAPDRVVAAGAEVARVRAGSDAGMAAVAFIAPAQAAQVAPGMSARVLVAGPNGGRPFVLEADLRDVSARPAPAPGWFAGFGFPTPDHGHLVRLSLRERSRPDAGRRRALPARRRHAAPGAHSLPGAGRERLMPGRGSRNEARPREHRRVRTPALLQFDETECGAVCLGIVLAHHGRWVRLEELRGACGVGRDGSSAGDLVGAAERYGLRVRGWRRQPAQLRRIRPPAILFWEFNHFLVLEGCGPDRFHLNDPANGRRSVSAEEFDSKFTGVVLTLEPGPDFRPGGARPGVVRQLWPWLRDAKAPLSFATACGLLMVLPGLALPLLLGLFVDQVLGGGESSWGFLPLAAAGAAGSLYLLAWLQQRCLRRLAVRLSVAQADRLLSHLFRLPVRYFVHRFAGDLASRVQLVDEVAAVGSTQLVGVAIEVVTSAVFLAVLLAVDPLLGAAVAAVAAVGVLAMRAVSRRRTDEKRHMQREGAMLTGLGGVALRSIDSLQATAAEDDFFSRWTGYQARELTARQRFSELGHLNAAVPGLFMMLGGAAVMGLGGWRVMTGGMTLGTLMALHVVAPAASCGRSAASCSSPTCCRRSTPTCSGWGTCSMHPRTGRRRGHPAPAVASRRSGDACAWPGASSCATSPSATSPTARRRSGT